MENLDVFAKFDELIEEKGWKVGIHTQTCVEWKLEHDNCVGCECELGCAKSVHIMMINLAPMGYEPKSYEDHANMQNRIQSLIERVIDAKTSEELKAIPVM